MDQVGGMVKAFSMPLVGLSEAMQKQKLDQKGGATVTYDNTISYVTSIIFMLLAGYLCWKCNMNEDTILRVIYTILAVIFNVFYLIYYFIYRVLMGNKCPGPMAPIGTSA